MLETTVRASKGANLLHTLTSLFIGLIDRGTNIGQNYFQEDNGDRLQMHESLRLVELSAI